MTGECRGLALLQSLTHAQADERGAKRTSNGPDEMTFAPRSRRWATARDTRDTRVVVAEPIEMESSFLDLDRGNSFDTIRSFDDGSSFHAF